MIVTSTGFASFLPPIDDSRTAYSPHFYQVEQHNFGNPYNGNDNVIRNAALTRAREAEKHGVSWILAELGIADTVENFDLHLQPPHAGAGQAAFRLVGPVVGAFMLW